MKQLQGSTYQDLKPYMKSRLAEIWEAYFNEQITLDQAKVASDHWAGFCDGCGKIKHEELTEAKNGKFYCYECVEGDQDPFIDDQAMDNYYDK
jgi:formylmethanofuran dehydrogenase subunit E